MNCHVQPLYMSDEVTDATDTTEEDRDPADSHAEGGSVEQTDTESSQDGSHTDSDPGATAEDAASEAHTDENSTTDTADSATDPESDTESETDPDSESETEPQYDTDLAREVAEHDTELAESVEELAAELREASQEVSDLEDRLKRSQADFQNYKKRAKKRREQVKERATEEFVTEIVEVRDNLVRALQQGEDSNIRPGVESTLEEFDRILATENVEIIDPEPGMEVDPGKHQVMMRIESDQPEGTIAEVYQPGYRMADKVLQEAQVTVSEESESESESE